MRERDESLLALDAGKAASRYTCMWPCVYYVVRSSHPIEPTAGPVSLMHLGLRGSKPEESSLNPAKPLILASMIG